jgi:hypothetical protein
MQPPNINSVRSSRLARGAAFDRVLKSYPTAPFRGAYLSPIEPGEQLPERGGYCPVLAISNQQSAVSSKTRLAKPSEFEVLCG